jgi:hypothetical protein
VLPWWATRVLEVQKVCPGMDVQKQVLLNSMPTALVDMRQGPSSLNSEEVDISPKPPWPIVYLKAGSANGNINSLISFKFRFEKQTLPIQPVMQRVGIQLRQTPWPCFDFLAAVDLEEVISYTWHSFQFRNINCLVEYFIASCVFDRGKWPSFSWQTPTQSGVTNEMVQFRLVPLPYFWEHFIMFKVPWPPSDWTWDFRCQYLDWHLIQKNCVALWPIYLEMLQWLPCAICTISGLPVNVFQGALDLWKLSWMFLLCLYISSSRVASSTNIWHNGRVTLIWWQKIKQLIVLVACSLNEAAIIGIADNSKLDPLKSTILWFPEYCDGQAGINSGQWMLVVILHEFLQFKSYWFAHHWPSPDTQILANPIAQFKRGNNLFMEAQLSMNIEQVTGRIYQWLISESMFRSKEHLLLGASVVVTKIKVQATDKLFVRSQAVMLAAFFSRSRPTTGSTSNNCKPCGILVELFSHRLGDKPNFKEGRMLGSGWAATGLSWVIGPACHL